MGVPGLKRHPKGIQKGSKRLPKGVQKAWKWHTKGVLEAFEFDKRLNKQFGRQFKRQFNRQATSETCIQRNYWIPHCANHGTQSCRVIESVTPVDQTNEWVGSGGGVGECHPPPCLQAPSACWIQCQILVPRIRRTYWYQSLEMLMPHFCVQSVPESKLLQISKLSARVIEHNCAAP